MAILSLPVSRTRHERRVRVGAGRWNDDLYADLAVGVPHETAAFLQQGAVSIFYGVLFADGFESSETCRWSLSSPADPNC